MKKKPIRRYTIDGKPMTPDDLRRLHDYPRRYRSDRDHLGRDAHRRRDGMA